MRQSFSILHSFLPVGLCPYAYAGGMFEYVSGANYFGEIVEWFGFAIASWSLPAAAFALMTLFNIGPRAIYHHQSVTAV